MQENAVFTPTELFNACSVLFGNDVAVSANFLKYLKVPGLKAAYRKRAFETHPDRAATLSESPSNLEERFKEVTLAYERLSTFIESPWKYSLWNYPFHKTAKYNSAARTPRTYGWQDQRTPGNDYRHGGSYGLREHYWQGNLPKTKLFLGRYLYYSRIISMRSLIEAIVWQKRQRPTVGNIAVQWDWLTQDDIRSILSMRNPGEKFCECALRCGYLSSYQQSILLVRQQMLQPRIGNYFINQNIVTQQEMEYIADQLRVHNRKYWRT
ncbi:MAG TPA: DnaJ domain-containing protein [Syntrophales bacterium]|nr:DnaJ domain-containing protein [Syntrophales bacterium]